MVSVIVPTHNRRELLEKKLRALEGQPGDFEVIVVADGCTDDTLEWLKSFHTDYPIRFLETEGKGAAYARNRGAEVAEGEILLFSDDDVIPGSGWVAAHRAAHSSEGRVVVGSLVLPEHLPRGVSFSGPRVFWWNATGANTSLAKRLFEQVGGYDESFSDYGGEDPDLGYRLMKVGARFVYTPAAKAEHWDEGYSQNLLTKARKAGSAHMRVYRKHKDSSIAWGLGVHPALLVLKMTFLPWMKGLFGPRGDFELAYAWGAWEEYQAPK